MVRGAVGGKGGRAAAAARAAAAEAARRSRAYRGGHDNGYSVHAPMAALALARLGASAHEVTAFAQHSLEDGARRFGVTPVPQPSAHLVERARTTGGGRRRPGRYVGRFDGGR